MKIISCIKQVPASSNVDVDPETGVLIRDGNNVKMNPYDLYALEAAYTIKAKAKDAKSHAITMGPPSAAEVLKEALFMGSDDASLLSDRAFAGADVLATAYTLSQMIRYVGDYDVIVCGKQTTDGDTAQVGPEIAEFLGIPHVPYVKDIVAVDDQILVVKSTYDDYEEVVSITMPCLITIDKGAFVPRLPSYRRKKSLSDYKIPMVTLKDLPDQNVDHYGLNGSPTQVEEIFPPSNDMETVTINETPEKAAEAVFEILKERRYV